MGFPTYWEYKVTKAVPRGLLRLGKSNTSLTHTDTDDT